MLRVERKTDEFCSQALGAVRLLAGLGLSTLNAGLSTVRVRRESRARDQRAGGAPGSGGVRIVIFWITGGLIGWLWLPS